jgi:hypothetical protein
MSSELCVDQNRVFRTSPKSPREELKSKLDTTVTSADTESSAGANAATLEDEEDESSEDDEGGRLKNPRPVKRVRTLKDAAQGKTPASTEVQS